MTSGTLIREARLRAGLSQGELSQRSGKDRAQIARWERDVVQPSFETLRELVRASGFDLDLTLVPYAVDERELERLRRNALRTPQERLQAMLRARRRCPKGLPARAASGAGRAARELCGDRRARQGAAGLGRADRWLGRRAFAAGGEPAPARTRPRRAERSPPGR